MISYPVFTHVVDLWEISQYGPEEFYAYTINAEYPGDILPLRHIKDEQGHDACYKTFDDAKAAIMAKIAEQNTAMNNRALFIATMRKPEMRLTRQALLHLKECGDDWQAITELEACRYGYRNDCWYLATQTRLCITLDADNEAHTPDDFFSFRLHNPDDPACQCEFCDIDRQLASGTHWTQQQQPNNA